MNRIVLTAVSILGVALAAWAQPRADTTRHARNLAQARVFLPDPSTTKLAASGFENALASLIWLRAGLVYGAEVEVGGRAPPDLPPWFEGMVHTANALDPRWRTPYFYGGLLLRAAGDLPASDRILEAGAAAFPQDWFFPANRAMNAYLHEDDPGAAATWMARAAELPGAPFWYRASAAGMKEKSGERAGAIRFLEEELAATTDPYVRQDMERSLHRLRHNALVAGWEDACRAAARAGHRLRQPQELAALGFTLPENPRGDDWVVGRDGVVRSATSELERARRAALAERALVAR